MPTTQDAVLRQMRTARRKNRGAERDWIDTSYELWVRGFFAVVVIVVVPIVLTGDELGAARGHALPRPCARRCVDHRRVGGLGRVARRRRGRAPRPGSPRCHVPAARTVLARTRAAAARRANNCGPPSSRGAVIGLAIGQAAAARLPEGPGAWAWHGSIAGAALGALLWGVVAATSSRRLSTLAANALGLLLLAAAVADAAFHTWFAPDHLGFLAGPSPLARSRPGRGRGRSASRSRWSLPVVAILAIGGTSLEPLRQRSALVSQMRFAASLQDMRTVVLLHRQLSMEKSRSRPWIPLPTRRKVRHPAWRRGWHGYLRWPPTASCALPCCSRPTGAGRVRGALDTPADHLGRRHVVRRRARLHRTVRGRARPPDGAAHLRRQHSCVLLRNLAAPVAALVGVEPYRRGRAGAGHRPSHRRRVRLRAQCLARGAGRRRAERCPRPAARVAARDAAAHARHLRHHTVGASRPPSRARHRGPGPVAVASTAGARPPRSSLRSRSRRHRSGALLYAALRGV